MVPTTSSEWSEPEALIRRLVASCGNLGLDIVVLETGASNRVRVRDPEAHSRMAETINLRRNQQAVYTWYWSWGVAVSSANFPIPAHDADEVAKAIRHVVGAGVP
jgi:hypothetical protein